MVLTEIAPGVDLERDGLRIWRSDRASGGVPAAVTEVAQFERKALDAGLLGLHLEEAKS